MPLFLAAAPGRSFQKYVRRGVYTMADDNAPSGPRTPRPHDSDRGGAGRGAPETPARLDACTSTPMALPAIRTMAEWCDLPPGNAGAQKLQTMLDKFRKAIASECGFTLQGPDRYAVVFTASASEANCTIIIATARAYAAKMKKIPHIVTTAAEHCSVLECCRRLVLDGLAHVTYVPVRASGHGFGSVDPEEVARALRPNTCLVSVIAAHHVTGAVADLKALGAITHKAKVPLHTDAAQCFGRLPLRLQGMGVDALSASFSKLNGPPGVGVLIVRMALVEGYGLGPLVAGDADTNDGLRGGAANAPAIAAAFSAFRAATGDGAAATAETTQLRDALRAALTKRYSALYLDAYRDALVGKNPKAYQVIRELAADAPDDEKGGTAPLLVWLSPRDGVGVLGNVLCFAIHRPGISGEAVRQALEEKGVFVGGPRYAEQADFAKNFDIPAGLREAVFVAALSPMTHVADAKKFVQALAACLSGQSWRKTHY
jgi:cysteine desulfurase